jgi:PAS domain-containing protein
VSPVEYLGIAIVPTAWLALALQYTGREKWLTRRNLALLAIEPFVTLLLAWTNELHQRGRLTGHLIVLRDITERKRAEEEIRQRTTQLEALRKVGLELTSQLDLDALLHSIVSRAIELLGGTEGGLYLYRPEQDVLEWAVSIGPNMASTGTVLHRGEGLSGRIWETGEPLIVDDYQHWEGHAAVYEGYPWTACRSAIRPPHCRPHRPRRRYGAVRVSR